VNNFPALLLNHGGTYCFWLENTDYSWMNFFGHYKYNLSMIRNTVYWLKIKVNKNQNLWPGFWNWLLFDLLNWKHFVKSKAVKMSFLSFSNKEIFNKENLKLTFFKFLIYCFPISMDYNYENFYCTVKYIATPNCMLL
jgi:hypothetical protein